MDFSPMKAGSNGHASQPHIGCVGMGVCIILYTFSPLIDLLAS